MAWRRRYTGSAQHRHIREVSSDLHNRFVTDDQELANTCIFHVVWFENMHKVELVRSCLVVLCVLVWRVDVPVDKDSGDSRCELRQCLDVMSETRSHAAR